MSTNTTWTLGTDEIASGDVTAYSVDGRYSLPGLHDQPTIYAPPPAVASLTWVNQNPGGGVAVAAAADRAGPTLALHCAYRTATNISALVATGTSIAACFEFVGTRRNYAAGGLCWYDGTKLETANLAWNGNRLGLFWSKWTNVTTFSVDREQCLYDWPVGHRIWLRLYDDGATYRRVQVWDHASQGWYDVAAPVSRTDFMTPTKVGVAINPQMAAGASGDGAGVLVRSWSIS